jgi:hypothetical protein
MYIYIYIYIYIYVYISIYIYIFIFNTGTKLAVFVDSAENLPGVLFALQIGPMYIYIY